MATENCLGKSNFTNYNVVKVMKSHLWEECPEDKLSTGQKALVKMLLGSTGRLKKKIAKQTNKKKNYSYKSEIMNVH